MRLNLALTKNTLAYFALPQELTTLNEGVKNFFFAHQRK
jgi:hypothetical protein